MWVKNQVQWLAWARKCAIGVNPFPLGKQVKQRLWAPKPWPWRWWLCSISMCPHLSLSHENIACLYSKATPDRQCDCDIINPCQMGKLTMNYSKNRSSDQTIVGWIESPMICISLVEHHTDFSACSAACDSWLVVSHLWTQCPHLWNEGRGFCHPWEWSPSTIQNAILPSLWVDVKKTYLEPENAWSPSWLEPGYTMEYSHLFM